jgi:hypothetical protein
MNQHIFRQTQPAPGFVSSARLFLASERGDVPGWVLITLMTAGLVVGLWALAGPALGHVFDQAITRVVAF